MARYPFITGVREFLEKDGDYYKEITCKSLDRKLRFFGKIFEELKKQGKVGTTNPRNINPEDVHAFVGNRIKNKVKNNVILHDLSTLKTFLLSFGNNAVDEYKIKYRSRVPRMVHNMREPLDESTVKRILERALEVDTKSWRLFEGYTLVSIALCTGLRPLELRQCLVSNIREDDLGFIIHAEHVKAGIRHLDK